MNVSPTPPRSRAASAGADPSDEPLGPPRSRPARIALAVYALLCLASLCWPLYPLVAGRAPALVLGLPFGLLWSLGWVTLTFVVAGLFYRVDGRGRLDGRGRADGREPLAGREARS